MTDPTPAEKLEQVAGVMDSESYMLTPAAIRALATTLCEIAEQVRGDHERLRGLLGAAQCPNDGCDGQGYPVPLGEHFVTHDMALAAGDPSMEGQSMGVEWGQEQCQWCHERDAALSTDRKEDK